MGMKGAKAPLLPCVVMKNFSKFLHTFVLLSSLLENGKFHKVSGRQSNEVLEHIYFIVSFSDVVESVIL